MTKLPKGWKKAGRGFGWQRRTKWGTLRVEKMYLLPRYRAEVVGRSSGLVIKWWEPITGKITAMKIADDYLKKMTGGYHGHNA